MPTFTEVLPPSKSEPHRAMTWTPVTAGVGVLELTGSKSHVRYALQVQPFGGVRLTKQGGEESYVVKTGSCDCAGFTFGRGKLCKHLEALHALHANRWLEHDERETVRDVHAEAEDRDQFYADDWGGSNDGGPDAMQDDEHADSIGRRIVCEMGGA